MTCTGLVQGRRVELDGDPVLAEGTRVRVIPEEAVSVSGLGDELQPAMSLGEWLDEARELRSRIPMTSASVEILRDLREGRAPVSDHAP